MDFEDKLRFLNVKSMLEAFWSRKLKESRTGADEGYRGKGIFLARGSSDRGGGSDLEGILFFG